MTCRNEGGPCHSQGHKGREVTAVNRELGAVTAKLAFQEKESWANPPAVQPDRALSAVRTGPIGNACSGHLVTIPFAKEDQEKSSKALMGSAPGDAQG